MARQRRRAGYRARPARWLEELGFELREMRPITEVARPGDFLWHWPRIFVEVGLERLVDLGRIDRARAQEIRRTFLHVESTPGAFSLTPTVLEIIARKR